MTLGVLLTLLPLLQTTMPPIVDYPNHLARAHILANWARFDSFDGVYEAGSLLIPNVLGDVIAMGLAKVTNTFEAGRLLLALILLTGLGGAFALHAAATGRFSGWPVLVVPFLYNEMFFWGFLNYLLGLALLMWGCASWLFLDRRGRAWQLLVGAAFALAIFLAHLVAFALFAIAIGLLELRRAWFARHEGARATLLRLAGSATCFVAPLLLFLLGSPSSELALRPNFSFDAFRKLSPFTRMLSSGNTLADVAVLVAVVAVVGLLLARRRLAADPALILIAGVFAALALALPHRAMGSFFLDSRIPIAAVVVGLTALSPRGLTPRTGAVLCVLLLSVITMRSAVIAADWRESDRYYQAVLPAFEHLPERGLLIAAAGTRWETTAGWLETRTVHPPHEHVAHYATVASGTPVIHLFAKRGQNSVVLEPRSSALRSLTSGPIRYVEDKEALAEFAKDIRERTAADPIFAKYPLFLVVFRVPCSEWPAQTDAKQVFCGPDISLMQLSGRSPERT